MKTSLDRQPLNDEMMRKVQNCLAILQEAQHMCNQAAQELCPVPGFAGQWSKLSAPYDAVKKSWYMVNDRLQMMRIRADRGQCPACARKIAADAAQCGNCGFTHNEE